MSLSGTVNTTWKYLTGSRSASRAIIHFSLSIAPHWGQWRLRQLLWAILKLPQSSHASKCPPMYSVRHLCRASNVLSLCRGRLFAALKAGRKRSITEASPLCLCLMDSRVKGIHTAKAFGCAQLGNVQVDKGCPDVAVAHGLLDIHNVLSCFELMGGIGMP